MKHETRLKIYILRLTIYEKQKKRKGIEKAIVYAFLPNLCMLYKVSSMFRLPYTFLAHNFLLVCIFHMCVVVLVSHPILQPHINNICNNNEPYNQCSYSYRKFYFIHFCFTVGFFVLRPQFGHVTIRNFDLVFH